MAWNNNTFLWLDLFTGEFVLNDNNWLNGFWFREFKDQYFYIGHYSELEEGTTKNNKFHRFRTVWSTR